jgi:hypothetical protein
MDADLEQDTEWRLLYAKLSGLLESAGEPDPYGDGDYWLVDDNRGSRQHKLCVFRIEAITSVLIDEIRKILKPFSPEWEVLVALDLKDKRYTGGPEGMLIKAAGVQELWDRRLLKQQLGYEYD